VKPRARSVPPLPASAISAAVAIGAVTLWELMSRAGVISPLLAPAPSAVVRAVFAGVVTGEMVPHLLFTLYRVVCGILIGGSAGVVVGLLMGTSRRLRDIADPFISAIYPIPKIAILPMVMAVLGIGDASRIAVISVTVFFPLMISTMNGVKQISRTHLDVARNYGASGTRLFRRVVLPASLPMILSGLRIGVNLALLITIAVEMVGATRGLGALIWMSWEVLRIEVVYASLVVIMLLGITFNITVSALSDALAPWSVERP
jgi:ABC-type nitrate/sulfonate/bicarbonate transport system permease component